MDNITIVLVSFFSKHHIIRLCKKLHKYKVIIVENSNDLSLKKILKKKNIKIFFPSKNLGYGCGNNYAIAKSKTKKVLILNPDVNISQKSIEHLIKESNKIKNYGILFPRLNSLESNKMFEVEKRKIIEINYKFVGKNIVSGCGMLINIEKLKKIGFFDKKIFLYKEETDLIKRCNDSSIKCYTLKNSKISHFGSQSHNNKISLEAELFRNWHWMWSNFYFYKKHFGFNYALIKFSKKLISSFLKKEIFFLFKNTKYKIYQARFNGLWNSIKNNPSNYRMNI